MSEEQSRAPREPREHPLRRRLKTLSGVLTATFWLCTGAAATNVRAYSIPTGSMTPTLSTGDRVLAVSPLIGGTPQRGEVWVFRGAATGGKFFVKRVVGVPGDTVEVRDGKVLVNGAGVDEPYVSGPPEYQVPAMKLQTGQYFVLGDNRPNSQDSHIFGPVGGEEFVGKVQVRYWPPQRVGGI